MTDAGRFGNTFSLHGLSGLARKQDSWSEEPVSDN